MNTLGAEVTDHPVFGVRLDHLRMVLELLHHSGREDVTAIEPLLHEDFRVLAIPGLAPARGYQSRTEFLAYFAESRRAGQVIRPDPITVSVLPSGAVLAETELEISRVEGDGPPAEVIATMPAWFVYRFREGKVASMASYLNGDTARAAAAEQAA